MPKIVVRRGLAAIGALVSAAALCLVAAQPAQARWYSTCDDYQSRSGGRSFLRIPSRSDDGLNCQLQEGDHGRGVRVLKIALSQCYGFGLGYGDYFDDDMTRAFRREQHRIDDPGPDGVYTQRTVWAGFRYARYEHSWGWDTTGRCDSWQ